jgi:hypothetical protein
MNTWMSPPLTHVHTFSPSGGCICRRPELWARHFLTRYDRLESGRWSGSRPSLWEGLLWLDANGLLLWGEGDSRDSGEDVTLLSRVFTAWVASNDWVSWLLTWWHRRFYTFKKKEALNSTGYINHYHWWPSWRVYTPPIGTLRSLLLQFLISVPKADWCEITSIHFKDSVRGRKK